MFALVFLVLGVQGEWVEISQQVFLKPLKHIDQNRQNLENTTLKPYRLEDTRSSERTKANRIYINSSLTHYSWNKDFDDSKWIDDDSRIKDKVIKNVNDEVVKSVAVVEQNSAQIKNSENKIKSKNNVKHSNNTDSSNKIKIINDVFKNSNKIQRIYFTSSEKPKVILNTDNIFKGQAIEVMNLSDLDYADTDDIVTAANNIKDIKKHITATIPLSKDKTKETLKETRKENAVIDKHNGNIKNNFNENVNSEVKNKITQRNDINTEKNTTKSNKLNNTTIKRNQNNRTTAISATLKTTPVSNIKEPNVIVTTTKAIIQKGQHKSPAIIKRVPNKAKIQKVQLTTTKATPRETSVARNESNRDAKKDIIKTDTKPKVTIEKDNNKSNKTETTTINPVSSTSPTKYQKLLFKPKWKPVLPSPDDVMVNELLKEDEIIKRNKTNITSVTETIDPSKNHDKVDITKPSSTETGIIQLDEATKEYTDENSSQDLHTDDSSINDEENDHFEDIIYSNFDTDIDRSDQIVQIPITMNIPVTSTVKIEPTEKAQDDITEAYVETYEHRYHPIILSESKSEFITKKEVFEENINADNNFDKVEEDAGSITSNNESEDLNKGKPKDDKQNVQLADLKENIDETTKSDVKEKDEEKVPNSLENLVRFLKVITETISRNARRTLKGKTRYLEDLRDTIMANIEQRIEAEFPDDSPRRSARAARGGEARGHVEFPSSESALMTISFLTFAVFLIKLVLQLIYAYKYKTMMAPAVVATIGRAYRQFQQPSDQN